MLKKKIGQIGETIAANFLRCKGYRVLEKNFRTRGGEIDLVCRSKKVVVFVEVKTRTSSIFGHPEEAITAAKLQKLEQMAQTYCQQKNYYGAWRIEVVAILINWRKKSFGIKHLTNL